MTPHRQIHAALLVLAMILGTSTSCVPMDLKPAEPTVVRVTTEPTTPPPAQTPPTSLTAIYSPLPIPTAVEAKQVPSPTPSASAPLPGQDPVERARADLARRLGLDASAITVLRVQADEFPISNLGCPGKGVRPMPAIVSGLEIVLATAGRNYMYRARKSTLVYCGPEP